MDTPCYYEIRVEGYLTDRWSAWFDGLAIRNEAGGLTALSGPFADQADLFGALAKIHALNLTLVSVNRSVPEDPDGAEATSTGRW